MKDMDFRTPFMSIRFQLFDHFPPPVRHLEYLSCGDSLESKSTSGMQILTTDFAIEL